MLDFNKLYNYVLNLDNLSYTTMLVEKAKAVLPKLNIISVGEENGEKIFFSFVLCAIYSDNKLSIEEYDIIKKHLSLFFGENTSYAETKNAAKKMKNEIKQIQNDADKMLDLFSLLDSKLKEDIVVVSLLICAIDNKISKKERDWIKKLID
jgi:hypothetical protein